MNRWRRWMGNNDNEGVNTMGSDWAGRKACTWPSGEHKDVNGKCTRCGSDAPAQSGRVRPVRPVPPAETAAHDDFVAQERARAEEMQRRDLGLYEAALTAFLDRVRALPELGGELASDQQFAELVTLESLLTAARARAQIINSRRRDRVGLFQQITGKPLPPYRPRGGMAPAEMPAENMPKWMQPHPPASAVDPSKCVNPWHTAGGESRARSTCPECPPRLPATEEQQPALVDRTGYDITHVDHQRAEVHTDNGEIFGLDPMGDGK